MNKRIIFSLLYSEGYFFLSRNFSLQKVGTIEWIKNNYGFGETCQFIDELIITFIKKNPKTEDYIKYFQDVNNLRKKIFIPITLGGRISTLENVKNCFLNGADKVLINSLFYDNSSKINEISYNYGNQAISLMIDFKIEHKPNYLKFISYKNCGRELALEINSDFVKKINNISCGEVIFNSIDNDGNGSGIDLRIINYLGDLKKPLLMMGGAGKPEHIIKILKLDKVSGVVTANLFNFLGNGLKETRNLGLKKNINLANFNNENKI